MSQGQPRGPHVSELLSAYLDNQLNPAERAKVQAHLATCPACAAELSDLQATVGLLARLPAVPLPRSFVLAEAPARPSEAPSRPPFREVRRDGASSLLDRLLGPAWGYGVLRLATIVATLLLVVLVSGDLLTQYLAPRAAVPGPTPAPITRQIQPSEALPATPTTIPAAPQAIAPTMPPAPAPLAAGSPVPSEAFKMLPTPLPTTVLPTRGPLPTATPGVTTDVTVATSPATATPSPAEPRAGAAALATATPSPTKLLPSATPTRPATATPTPRPPTPTPTRTPTPPPPTPTAVPTATSSPTPLPPTPTVALAAGEAKGQPSPTTPAAPVRGLGELAGLPIVRWVEFGLAGLVGVLLMATLVARPRRR